MSTARGGGSGAATSLTLQSNPTLQTAVASSLSCHEILVLATTSATMRRRLIQCSDPRVRACATAQHVYEFKHGKAGNNVNVDAARIAAAVVAEQMLDHIDTQATPVGRWATDVMTVAKKIFRCVRTRYAARHQDAADMTFEDFLRKLQVDADEETAVEEVRRAMRVIQQEKELIRQHKQQSNTAFLQLVQRSACLTKKIAALRAERLSVVQTRCESPAACEQFDDMHNRARELQHRTEALETTLHNVEARLSIFRENVERVLDAHRHNLQEAEALMKQHGTDKAKEVVELLYMMSPEHDLPMLRMALLVLGLADHWAPHQ